MQILAQSFFVVCWKAGHRDNIKSSNKVTTFLWKDIQEMAM
jgi:hypothetical protein